MSYNTQSDTVIKELEQDFKNKVTDLALSTAKSSNIVTISDTNQLKTQLHKDFQVDAAKLSKVATNVIDKNEKLSDKEVAIELLKDIAINGKTKMMKKLASKMLSEKWWEK
ncbi:hypothetical protein COJ96_10850 [Bacillus sp. AFS073361]|uniref:hypothetical protein n=1 Tax=Bacillus sp. AFS073361 TaxID=2033511 RepID=UPI000BF40E03|nr:hypothetical protein [Bacillus sp. AFS073361]PFP29394.1 hypothetical protein COJ96_10850 [Bacillus sp. AFS073361]